jgi:hypothetical protein
MVHIYTPSAAKAISNYLLQTHRKHESATNDKVSYFLATAASSSETFAYPNLVVSVCFRFCSMYQGTFLYDPKKLSVLSLKVFVVQCNQS